jgi:hypothetical protein
MQICAQLHPLPRDPYAGYVVATRRRDGSCWFEGLGRYPKNAFELGFPERDRHPDPKFEITVFGSIDAPGTV